MNITQAHNLTSLELNLFSKYWNGRKMTLTIEVAFVKWTKCVCLQFYVYLPRRNWWGTFCEKTAWRRWRWRWRRACCRPTPTSTARRTDTSRPCSLFERDVKQPVTGELSTHPDTNVRCRKKEDNFSPNIRTAETYDMKMETVTGIVLKAKFPEKYSWVVFCLPPEQLHPHRHICKENRHWYISYISHCGPMDLTKDCCRDRKGTPWSASAQGVIWKGFVPKKVRVAHSRSLFYVPRRILGASACAKHDTDTHPLSLSFS